MLLATVILLDGYCDIFIVIAFLVLLLCLLLLLPSLLSFFFLLFCSSSFVSPLLSFVFLVWLTSFAAVAGVATAPVVLVVAAAC